MVSPDSISGFLPVLRKSLIDRSKRRFVLRPSNETRSNVKFYFTRYRYRVIRCKNIVIVIFTYTMSKIYPRYYTLQFNRVICAVANFIYRKRIHQGSESEAAIGSWRRMLFRSVRLLRPLYFRALCQQTNGSFSIPYMYVHSALRLWINASAIQRTT